MKTVVALGMFAVGTIALFSSVTNVIGKCIAVLMLLMAAEVMMERSKE